MFIKIIAFIAPPAAEFLLWFSLWAAWNEFSARTFSGTAVWFDAHVASTITFLFFMIFAKIFVINWTRDSLGYRSVGSKSRTQQHIK
jgi:hypothetical protein